jgi:hypothetical protein
MTARLWAVTLFALSAFGADVSGKWTGTFTRESDGEKREISVVMELKQDGTKLTGTVGPASGESVTVEVGTIDGNKIHFEAQPPGGNDGRLSFDLMVDGDRISGDVKGERDGEARHGKVEFKRGS